jgi:hypothetical protein
MLPKADGKRNPSKRLILGVAMIAKLPGRPDCSTTAK